MFIFLGFTTPFLILLPAITAFFLIRFISRTSLLLILLQWFRSFMDRLYLHQFYKVPQYNEHFQENQFFTKVSAYLTSLPAMEDSDFTNLFSGPESNDIILHLDPKQVIHDTFLGARFCWSIEQVEPTQKKSFVLKLRKKDKRRILRSYLQHILSVADEIEQKNKEIKLYMNLNKDPDVNGRWRSVSFTHPATMDTVIMDSDLKNKLKSDLEMFLKSKQYYHRLGRVWKRSYLLYGASGTGKSSFIAAMARLLSFDVYEVNISNVSDDSDLRMLMLQTTPRSLIVIEDIDRILSEKSLLSSSGMLNFMDGIISSCGEERVTVFTMSNTVNKNQIDESILRPGRIDVHVEFPLCNFPSFKSLASSYLGVKEHKLFPQVEEIFQAGVTVTPAEISEIMISNRTSPTRALKSVVTALQTMKSGEWAGGQRLSKSRSVRSGEENEPETGNVVCRESVHTVREFRTLYGLLKGSRRKESLDLGWTEKEGSKHDS